MSQEKEAFKAGYRFAEEVNHGEWTSVEDHLPFGEDHLLYVDGGNGVPGKCIVGYFNRLTKCWMIDCAQQPDIPVTHWMLLPDPPK